MAEYTETQRKILKIGKREFLAKGFKDASLRGIVKEAGFTQGAFYGYYPDKAALFDALVSEVADGLMEQFKMAQQAHFELIPEDKTAQSRELSTDYLNRFINFIYDNFDTFKLLICSADGTEYENFIHTLVEVEVKATHQFIAVLKSLGYHVKKIDSQLEHMLISGMFSGFFEIVVHDMPQEQAAEYIKELREFYTAGWTKIMGLS